MWKNDGREIIASSGDSAFVLIDDEFRLVFDFTRKAGDTIVVTDKPFDGLFLNLGDNSPDFKHFKYRIDSLVNIATGDDILNVQYVSHLEDPRDSIFQWGFQNTVALAQQPPYLGRILKGVGSLGFDTPFGTAPGYAYLGNLALQELTCYSDSFRTINFMGIDCDSLVEVFEKSSAVIDNEINNLEIFPNPFTSILNIKIPYFHDYKILIYDIRGYMIATLLGGEEAYDLSHLAAGTYMIKVISKERSYKVFKVNKL
jgi:hypothetical protein